MKAYVLGILICLSLPGLVIGLLKPKLFKPLLGKLARRSVVATIFGLILLASVVLSIRHKQVNKNTAKTNTPQQNNRVIWKDLSERVSKSPKSGELQYEILTPIDKSKPLSGRIKILTPEKIGDRLIQLTDKLLAQFKDDKIIAGNNQVFYLDYFDDKQVAETYFAKQSDKTTTLPEKQKLADHYVAIMVWQKPIGLSSLLFIPTGQILKSY